MFRAQVIKEHDLAGVITIEPAAWEAFIVEVGPLVATEARLACTRFSVNPPIIQGFQVMEFLSVELVQGSCCKYLWVVFNRKLTGFY